MLEVYLPVVMAQRTLRDKGGKLTPESLREVVLEATGDEDEADRAYCRRVQEVEPR